MKMSEIDLVIKLRDTKRQKEEIENALKLVKEELIKTESLLIEALNAEGKEASARYEGIGFVSLSKPQLFASYLKDNEETVFEFVRSQGREDLIKPTIHARSLSSYVGELIERGEKVPEYVNYYLKPQLKFYER